MFLNMEITRWDSVFQLIGLIILFILILIATYYTTKWVGKVSNLKPKNSNMKLLESYPIGQNKMLQIVKVGAKYLLISVTKEQIQFICELSEEELHFDDTIQKPSMSFKEVLAKMKENKEQGK